MDDILIFVGAVVGVSLALGYALKGLEGLEMWLRKVLNRSL